MLPLVQQMPSSFQFVLPAATVAVAKLDIHYVEYSAMCNCVLWEVQTGLILNELHVFM